jgi:single stranded DNA-binding protein
MAESNQKVSSSDVNHVILIGRMTRDPELHTTQGGASVATVDIATNRVFTRKDGTQESQPCYHRVVMWGKLGENIARFGSKGRKVSVQGYLQQRSYDSRKFVDGSGLSNFASSIKGQKTVSVDKVLEVLNGCASARMQQMELVAREVLFQDPRPQASNETDEAGLPHPEDDLTETPF